MTSSRYGTIRANLQTPMPPQLWHSVLVMQNSATNETMGLVYFGTFTRPTIRSKSQYSHSPPLDTPGLIHHHFCPNRRTGAGAHMLLLSACPQLHSEQKRGCPLQSSRSRPCAWLSTADRTLTGLTVHTPRITNKNSSH